MINHLREKYRLSQNKEIRLDAICNDIAALVQCMNYLGLQDFKKSLRSIPTQENDKIFQIELLNYYENNSKPKEIYTQILFDIELMYIKLYMLNETIHKHQNLPSLQIENLKLFRLAFAHSSTNIIFQKEIPSIQYVKWFKKDLSEICYTFLDWDFGSRDVVMKISNDITKFQNWWKEVFESEENS